VTIKTLFVLVRLRWSSRRGLLIAREKFPTLEEKLTANARFTASGWRNDAENYLFTSRADAEAFKKGIQQIPHRTLKAKIDIVEITAEDVAHLDLDPVQRSKRHVAI